MKTNEVRWPTIEEVRNAGVDQIVNWVMTLPQPVTAEQEEITEAINSMYVETIR